jgi:hypothetical protein
MSLKEQCEAALPIQWQQQYDSCVARWGPVRLAVFPWGRAYYAAIHAQNAEFEEPGETPAAALEALSKSLAEYCGPLWPEVQK